MADNVPKLPTGTEVTGAGPQEATTTGSKRTAGTDLDEPPSDDEEQQRVGEVAGICAELDMAPRSEEKNSKPWQESTTSLQSPLIIKLKKSLRQRKLRLRIYTANPNFLDYFYVPRGPEYRPMPSLIESTMGSKEEVVAREIIHKTALKQLRKLQGVWSELGKPYVSLGEPNVNVSHATPMLEKPYGEDGFQKLATFDFFPLPPITPAQRLKMHTAAEEAQMPASKKKRELVLKHARAASERDQMLEKMGLQFLHDSDHAKFPKAPLVAGDKLTNVIKQGGNYIEEKEIGMMSSLARRQSMGPLTGEQFILGAGGKAIPVFADGPPPPPPKPATLGSEASTTHPSSPKKDPSPAGSTKSKSGTKTAGKKFPPRDDSLVFGWKKRILELRLKLESDLKEQITMRSDRREQWRSSSLFSAEVARKVYELLHKTHGQESPDTTTAWKEALFNYNARQIPHMSPWESKILSIHRFYDRVCTFTEHQPFADPLLDVLIYFVKEWLENGGKMRRSLLEHLCASLARLPDEIMVLGRMACVMPVLSFICKELHINSTQFKNILRDTKLDRCHLG